MEHQLLFPSAASVRSGVRGQTDFLLNSQPLGARRQLDSPRLHPTWAGKAADAQTSSEYTNKHMFMFLFLPLLMKFSAG